MRSWFKAKPIVSLVISSAVVGAAYGQSTPAEFAELSIQQLLNVELDNTESNQTSGQWQFQYQLRHAEFEGYMDGDADLSTDEVLWSGPSETRTQDNYPIVPTLITQNVHLFSLTRSLTSDWSISINAPFIRQETDHISIVPGYDTFLIKTDGLGDVVVKGNYQITSTADSAWVMSTGISLPTGSIDEVGDTPRDHGNQPLPYTMQLGSGTFDIPIELGYHSDGDHHFMVAMSAMVRTGRNDRGYRLGHNASVNARYYWYENDTIQWFTGLGASYRQAIRGRDQRLLVDGPFPFPASITDPANYGGKKVAANVGIVWKPIPNLHLAVDFNKPLYQYLNGPQPQEVWSSSFTLVSSFD